MEKLPDWLTKKENYTAKKSNTAFISKTVLHLTSTIGRVQKVVTKKEKPESLFFLVFVVVSILLMALSKNMFFTYIVFAGLIVRLCFLDEKELSYVIHYAIRAFLLSCLILLPALFIGNGKTILTVSLKVFISTGLLCLFHLLYSTNEIISCLKMLHIPDIFIFTLDTTFKYIVILSRSCEEILNALTCRIIGRRKEKDTSMTNVVGMTFVRAQKHSEEMYDAMKCRGFTGKYYNHIRLRIRVYDVLIACLCVIEIGLFVYLER